MIQSFGFTHELAWKTLKDLLEYKGVAQSIIGSRDSARLAFSVGLVDDGDLWMEMIKSRSQTSHTYNEAVADTIAAAILSRDYPALEKLRVRLEEEGAE